MRIVGGVWAGRRIEAPSGRGTRPTSDRVREAWMSAIAAHLPDARVLDLFAGSGALGLESLSRGAREVTFVERAAPARRSLEANIGLLAVPSDAVHIVRSDVYRFLETLAPLEYDVALADPPYRMGNAERLRDAYMRTPFARLFCIEHSRDEPVASDLIVRERRYGDSILTFLAADHAE